MDPSKFVLEFAKLDESRVAISPEDAKDLGLDVGDIVRIIDEMALELGGAKVEVKGGVARGTFQSSESFAESLSVDEGFEYVLKRYEGEMSVALEKVILDVTEMGAAADMARSVTREHKLFEAFLRGKVINRGLKIRWPDKNVNIEIRDTVPKLQDGQYVIVGDIAQIELYAVGIPFNGVLLVDVSNSMNQMDMVVDERVLPMLNSLHLLAENAMPSFQEYIKTIEQSERIRRIDSAALSAMLYLSEKVARGQGEKTAIITYSDQASPLSYRFKEGEAYVDIPWYDISKGGIKEDEKREAAVVIGDALLLRIDQAESKNTNMEAALVKARDVILQMKGKERAAEGGRLKPVMVVFLTDGEYNVGRSPVRVIQEAFGDMEGVVLHMVGIGESVDEALLKRCAELGKGEYCKAENLLDLVAFYSRNAKRFGTSAIL
jgi:hypothetical protein